jgi:TRAP-type C4-dicarboxylate transport system permease small subunit
MVKKIARGFISGIDHIAEYAFICSEVMILLMCFITTYGALRRYIFRSPDSYAYFGISYLMLASAALSLANTEKLEKHLKVDLVTQHLPVLVRKILRYIFVPLTGLVFSGVFFWKSFEDTWFALQAHQNTFVAVTVPTFPIKIMVPIGTCLLFLVILTKIVRNFFSIRSG